MIMSADPIFAAIHARRAAKAAMDAAEQWPAERDGEISAVYATESVAVTTLLTTVPTTAAGLRAYLLEGARLLEEVQQSCGADPALWDGLGDWAPMAGQGDYRTVEQMFHATLALAARSLLPDSEDARS